MTDLTAVEPCEPIAPWFGGKRYLAAAIDARIGALIGGAAQALFGSDERDGEQIEAARARLAPVLAALARLDQRAPAGMLNSKATGEAQ